MPLLFPPPPPTSFFGYGKVIIKKKNCSLNFERTFARISFRVNHLFLEVSRQKNSPIPFFWRYALSVYVYLLLIEKYLQMLEVTTNLICFLSVWSCEREKKYKNSKNREMHILNQGYQSFFFQVTFPPRAVLPCIKVVSPKVEAQLHVSPRQFTLFHHFFILEKLLKLEGNPLRYGNSSEGFKNLRSISTTMVTRMKVSLS